MIENFRDFVDRNFEFIYNRKTKPDGWTYVKFFRGRDVSILALVVVLAFAAALFLWC